MGSAFCARRDIQDSSIAGLIARTSSSGNGSGRTPEGHQTFAGSVEDWATESLLAARQAYQDPATGQRIKPGTMLGDVYQAANLPVAKRRLYQAGARLAWVLKDTSRPE